MEIWYTAREVFDKNDSGWNTYIQSSNLTQTQEIITLDSMLSVPAFKWDSDKEDDWEFAITTDNEIFVDLYSNLEYVIKKSKSIDNFNLLAVTFRPEVSCESLHLDNFDFIGYDLMDQDHSNSALTNCGGFPESFNNSELNSFGLLNNYTRAIKIQTDLKNFNKNEFHADTNIWAIWRHKIYRNKAGSHDQSRSSNSETAITNKTT